MAVQAQYPPRAALLDSLNANLRSNGETANSTSSSLLRKRSRDDFAAVSMPQQLYYQQSLEMEALLRHKIVRMRLEYEELRKRQEQILMLSIEQRVAKAMGEKEAELETANRRNAELLEKATKMAAERQIWMNMVRNNEVAVANLRYALLQSSSTTVGAPGGEGEGQGDNDDAQSCCYEEGGDREEHVSRACKSCGGREACVVMLPCRHLCLCKECESEADTCPVCRCSKRYTIEVLMSS